MLSCVLYYLIENFVCVDYIFFQSKTLSSIYFNRIFEQKSYNILLGIGIPEVLLNLVSCHVFMERPNSTIVLNFRCLLVNNYLSKGFFIIENNSKQLSIIPNDVKLIIHGIEKLETDFVMEKKTAIYSVANIIKKLHIHSYLHLIYKKHLIR